MDLEKLKAENETLKKELYEIKEEKRKMQEIAGGVERLIKDTTQFLSNMSFNVRTIQRLADINNFRFLRTIFE